jgi:hypothetical protein
VAADPRARYFRFVFADSSFEELAAAAGGSFDVVLDAISDGSGGFF